MQENHTGQETVIYRKLTTRHETVQNSPTCPALKTNRTESK